VEEDDFLGDDDDDVIANGNGAGTVILPISGAFKCNNLAR